MLDALRQGGVKVMRSTDQHQPLGGGGPPQWEAADDLSTEDHVELALLQMSLKETSFREKGNPMKELSRKTYSLDLVRV